MASYYIIEKNEIVNIILAETKEIAEQVTGLEAIEFDDNSVAGATIGAKLDTKSGVYVNPNIEAEAQ
jgi:hypothetical protein